MSHLSKGWLFLICLLSYCTMGQAGCQTTSPRDTTYMRSDLVRIKRDVAEIKKQMGTPGEVPYQDVMRNQAVQQEALIELKDGQQRSEAKIEEARYEIAELRQEITNLKLNLINQLEALRAGNRTAIPQQPIQPVLRPAPLTQPVSKPAPSAPAPSIAQPARVPAPVVPAPVVPAPVVPAPKPVVSPAAPVAVSEPINYTKLYDTAYEDYVRKSYALSRNGFEEYLRLFPDTDLADNAQYWIGECYSAEEKYEEAVAAFKQVITRYPTGNKVPRAMLKAGYALIELEREDQARAMFRQVIDAYPLSSEADQAKTKLKKIN